MSIVIYILRQSLFHKPLLSKNLLIFVLKKLCKTGLLCLQNFGLLSGILNVDFKLCAQLLEIFHFLFIVVVLMV